MADLIVPQLGESITEAVISRWLKQVGDAVAADEPVVDLETDKVTVQLSAPSAGALSEQRAPVGATVRVGQVVGAVAEGGGAGAGRAAAPAAVAAKPVVAPSVKSAMAAPATTLAATPPAADVDKEALLRLTPAQRAAAREAGQLPAPGTAGGGGAAVAERSMFERSARDRSAEDAARLAKVDARDEVVAMSPLRRRIAERLVEAQRDTASLTTFNEVDMSAVMDLRARYKDAFEKAHGVKLGFMSFFVKACVDAARLFPGLNAEVIGGNIVYKKHYDFGIAVSSPKGLVVPVLRDCDRRSFADVEEGIAELAEKARTGRLALPDLTGGTFSISNGGIYGSMMSTPLLNMPQTGILGMHNISKRAVVVQDQIVVRPMMYLALTYDHRVVDGREAVSFLVAVKDRLEAPDRMLLLV